MVVVDHHHHHHRTGTEPAIRPITARFVGLLALFVYLFGWLGVVLPIPNRQWRVSPGFVVLFLLFSMGPAVDEKKKHCVSRLLFSMTVGVPTETVVLILHHK